MYSLRLVLICTSNYIHSNEVVTITISIQVVPYTKQLTHMTRSAKSSLKISSPFITASAVNLIQDFWTPPQILTKVTAQNLSSNALDGRSLRKLIALGATIKSIPNLHAKIYLVDDSEGLVTSSNLTRPGLQTNVELGVYFKNETQLFNSVERFFNRMWDEAEQVTLESLDFLESRSHKVYIHQGICKRIDEDARTPKEETQVPIPAIGYLYTDSNITELNTTSEGSSFDNVVETDESEELLGLPPLSTSVLISQLSSDIEAKVQLALNSFSLMSPKSLNHWLGSMGVEDLSVLVNNNNPYPYKRFVLNKIIEHGSAKHLFMVIENLVGSAANEAQYLLYEETITARLQQLDKEDRRWMVEGLSQIAVIVVKMVGKSRLGEKNFAKPNLDRIIELIRLCGGTYFVRHQEDVSSIHGKIPSYQELKRMRESKGQGFWQTAIGFFPQVTRGDWNHALPAMSSLFKEVSKLKLTKEQEKLVLETVSGTIEQIDHEAKGGLEKLLSYAEEIHSQLNAQDRSLWREACREALRRDGKAIGKTGRLIYLYGSWIKEGKIQHNNDFKRILDYLTTYHSTRHVLSKILDAKRAHE